MRDSIPKGIMNMILHELMAVATRTHLLGYW